MSAIEAQIKDIESDECTNEEYVLHRLLELAVAATGEGSVGKDYTKTIEFPIGGASIQSDPYYQRVSINTDDIDLEIEDTKTIKKLSNEIKKRLIEFDKRIKKTRTELAEEIFKKSINHIVDLDDDEETEAD